MTNIFVSSAREDAECSEHILEGLEAKGYSIWREPPSLSLEAFLPSQTSRTKEENAILGSATVILIWSGHAAQAEQVKQQLSFAQQLKKQVLSIVIDTTGLPPALVTSTLSLVSQPPCADAVAQLLLHLPAADSTDPLITISRDMTNERILTRKEAIDTAATLLKQDAYRERVLALLEYVASNDTMTGVRDKAQEVLDAEKGGQTPPQRSS